MFLSMGGINHQTMGGFLLLRFLLNLFIGLPEGREILLVFFGGGVDCRFGCVVSGRFGISMDLGLSEHEVYQPSWLFLWTMLSFSIKFLNCCGATHFAARNAKERTPGSSPTSRRIRRAESSRMWDGEITKTQQVGSWTQCYMVFFQTITWCAHPKPVFFSGVLKTLAFSRRQVTSTRTDNV